MDRKYTHHSGKVRDVLAWIQRRCIKCGRFLSLKQIKFCSKCAKKELNVYQNNHRKTEYGRIRHSIEMYIYRHINELEVGDYV